MFNNLNYMCANLLCINNDGVAPYLTRPSKLRLPIIGLFLFYFCLCHFLITFFVFLLFLSVCLLFDFLLFHLLNE